MIIKSHVRKGFWDAASYLKEQGKNEKIRTVEISDIDARNLDEAFRNMWEVASNTKVKKALHHISINPYKDERLTDEQVLRIVERCEQVYGYKPGDHQRVIVEHIKDGRQHFHVMWNRVSLKTGKAVWPGLHWNKSKQVAREMEQELGLRRVSSKRTRRAKVGLLKTGGRYRALKQLKFVLRPRPAVHDTPANLFRPAMRLLTTRRRKRDENIPDSEKYRFTRRPEQESAELIRWAWEHGRLDILAQFGILLPEDYFDP